MQLLQCESCVSAAITLFSACILLIQDIYAYFCSIIDFVYVQEHLLVLDVQNRVSFLLLYRPDKIDLCGLKSTAILYLSYDYSVGDNILESNELEMSEYPQS